MKKMTISRDLTITDLKRQFFEVFNHLKIEFYGHSHKVGEGSAYSDQIDSGTELIKINPKLQKGVIEFEKEMTVKDFETLMEEKYGLHVQVFRKSAELWLQTSSTDHWTLVKQDGKGGRSEAFAD